MRYERPYPPQPRMLPFGLVLAVTLVALVVIGGILGWLAWQFTLLDPTVAGVLRVAIFVLLYGVPAGGAAVGLLTAYNRWARPEVIKAEKVIQLTQAQRQLFPAALTSLTYHHSHKELPAPPVELPALPEPELPGAIDLAALDVRPSEKHILLGLDSSGPITVSVTQLCHVALLGATGGGKSNLLRLIIPQLQAFGASIALADAHYAPIDPESGDDWRLIESRLRFAPAVNALAIDQVLSFMTEELERRLERRRKNEKVGVPLFLAFDELPSICDLLPDAPARIGKLLREGRKVHLLTIGASQSLLIVEGNRNAEARDSHDR